MSKKVTTPSRNAGLPSGSELTRGAEYEFSDRSVIDHFTDRNFIPQFPVVGTETPDAIKLLMRAVSILEINVQMDFVSREQRTELRALYNRLRDHVLRGGG